MTVAATSILTPALALVVLSLVVWAIMVVARPRAMIRARISWQSARYTRDLTYLPRPARDIADNYNHLMEQPTIFYAIVFYTYLAGNVDFVNVGLAWAYVAVRAVHSVIQMTVNLVHYRFCAFFVSTGMLIVLAIRNLAAL